MRGQRRALSSAQRRRAARCLAGVLMRSRLLRRARHLACYLANDGEMDLLPFVRRAWSHGRRIYLPLIDVPRRDHLGFAEFHAHSRFKANRFGIDEPVGRRRAVRRLDAVLMPLVAFDACGNRLGMGGGFYDRTFAYLSRQRHWRRPRLIGIAYGFQQVDALEHRPWDVPLDAVVTDKGVIQCDKGEDGCSTG